MILILGNGLVNVLLGGEHRSSHPEFWSSGGGIMVSTPESGEKVYTLYLRIWVAPRDMSSKIHKTAPIICKEK